MRKYVKNAWYVQTQIWRFLSEVWKCLRGGFAPSVTFSQFIHISFNFVPAHIRHYSHVCATFFGNYNYSKNFCSRILKILGVKFQTFFRLSKWAVSSAEFDPKHCCTRGIEISNFIVIQEISVGKLYFWLARCDGIFVGFGWKVDGQRGRYL